MTDTNLRLVGEDHKAVRAIAPAKLEHITLRIGGADVGAYVILKDCRVVDDPMRPHQIVVTVDGIDIRPSPDKGPLEIEVRNARVRY